MAVLGPPMLTGEQAVEIRVLKRQGKSIHAIARELGVSRVSAGARRRSERSSLSSNARNRPFNLCLLRTVRI